MILCNDGTCMTIYTASYPRTRKYGTYTQIHTALGVYFNENKGHAFKAQSVKTFVLVNEPHSCLHYLHVTRISLLLVSDWWKD